jgi:hypothetical protein
VIYAPPPPEQYGYVPPPPGPAMYETEPVRAPRYSLWLGGRLGLLLYGGSVYFNDTTGYDATASSFITNGLALEADVGARISKRYIPYLGVELGLVGPGSSFQGTSASAGTSFVGLGFRFLAGNVNFVSFASDLSFGYRKFQVTNEGNTWTASAFEFLRLGLGADIRFTDYFTISPMVTLSGGTLTTTSGAVNFSNGTPLPSAVTGGQIPSPWQSNYYAIVLGCGAHFDLFGAH